MAACAGAAGRRTSVAELHVGRVLVERVEKRHVTHRTRHTQVRDRPSERRGEARSLEQAGHAAKSVREGEHRSTVGALADQARPDRPVLMLQLYFRVQAVAAPVDNHYHLLRHCAVQLLNGFGLAKRGIQPHVVSSVGLLPAAELSNPWRSGAIRSATDGCGGSVGFEPGPEACDSGLRCSLRLGQPCVADEGGGFQVVSGLEAAVDAGDAKIGQVDRAEVHGSSDDARAGAGGRAGEEPRRRDRRNCGTYGVGADKV